MTAELLDIMKTKKRSSKAKYKHPQPSGIFLKDVICFSLLNFLAWSDHHFLVTTDLLSCFEC